MKKVIMMFSCLMIAVTMFAQRNQTNVTDSTCFCCDGFYNLPVPVITGPTTVDCSASPKFSIQKCKTATITWSVSPTVPFTGNGTNTITLTPPLSAAAYSIKVIVKCGTKEISSTKVLSVTSVKNCTAQFNLTLTNLANGLLKVDANPTTTTAGVQHYWGLIPNPTPANCTAVPLTNILSGLTFGAGVSSTGVFTSLGMGTGKTASTSGYGFQYSGIGGTTAGCYKLTHYVNCCGIWYKQTYCFCVVPNSQGARTQSPTLNKTEVEMVDENDIPTQLKNK